MKPPAVPSSNKLFPKHILPVSQIITPALFLLIFHPSLITTIKSFPYFCFHFNYFFVFEENVSEFLNYFLTVEQNVSLFLWVFTQNNVLCFLWFFSVSWRMLEIRLRATSQGLTTRIPVPLYFFSILRGCYANKCSIKSVPLFLIHCLCSLVPFN